MANVLPLGRLWRWGLRACGFLVVGSLVVDVTVWCVCGAVDVAAMSVRAALHAIGH